MNDAFRLRLQQQPLEQTDMKERQVGGSASGSGGGPDAGVLRAVVVMPLREFFHLTEKDRVVARGERPFLEEMAHDLPQLRKNSRLAGRTKTLFVRVHGSRSTAVQLSGRTASACAYESASKSDFVAARTAPWLTS